MNKISDKYTVATSPQLVRIKFTLGASLAILLFVIISIIYRVSLIYHSSIGNFPLLDLESAIEIGLISICSIVYSLISFRFWKRINSCRFSIVNSDNSQQEVHSFSKKVEVLSLSFRLNKTYVYLSSLMVLIVFILLFVRILLPLQGKLFTSFLPILLIIFLFIIIATSAFAIQSSLTSHIVEITEDGIEARRRRKREKLEQKKIVKWQDAHLFVCYKLPIFLGYETFIYEVSSNDEVIFWYWLLKPESFLTLWKPELSVEQYQEQMHMVRSFVTQKTGLPLHDLSRLVDEIHKNG